MREFDYDVIIPTRVRSVEFLDAAIGSVLGQTVRPQKVIVVVDGDDSAAARLAIRWPSVVVVPQPGPAGAAAARQAGIGEATARWVCFLDDDDLWSPRKMAVTAEYIAAHPDCRAVRSTYLVFTDGQRPAEAFSGQAVDLHSTDLCELERHSLEHAPVNDLTYLDIEGRSLALLLDRNRGVIGSSCVERSLLMAIPAVPPGTHPGDDHLLFCLVATQAEWHLIGDPLLFYRLHEGQDTRHISGAGARGIIAARRVAWELCGPYAKESLSSYGERYRREFRVLLWVLIRSGRVTEAVRAYLLCMPILPRWRDRLLLLVPEPIAWRWRYRRWDAEARRTRVGSTGG